MREKTFDKVKDFVKENEMLATDKRHPCGPVPAAKREIKHIHHPAVKKFAVTASGRKKYSRLRRKRIVEYQPVEHTVDNIAGSPRNNKGNTYEITVACLPARRDAAQIAYQKSYRGYAEKRE